MQTIRKDVSMVLLMAISNGWRPLHSLLPALFFAPFYIRADVATLPDFLGKRYKFLAALLFITMIVLYIVFRMAEKR